MYFYYFIFLFPTLSHLLLILLPSLACNRIGNQQTQFVASIEYRFVLRIVHQPDHIETGISNFYFITRLGIVRQRITYIRILLVPVSYNLLFGI